MISNKRVVSESSGFIIFKLRKKEEGRRRQKAEGRRQRAEGKIAYG
ncbi:MAG: hypothetical protein F6K17_14935 [Okeania sp. SIO3C4]|nr:hypothetical protein [Okeania sp. SIO3B3]NER03820.1 hypothetical protein [Okeania sp. SIO3C4]